ncbi:hypothetical protein GCM10022249_01730 [Enteractinococcus coprophilus]
MAQLRDLAADGTFYKVQFRNLWLATLGRVVIIQALEETDTEMGASDLEFGMTCLKHANNYLPRIQEHQQFHRLEIEILKERARIEEARMLLEANEFLKNLFYGYLLSDLDNPTISRDPETYKSWMTGFNRPFIENGLLPLKPSPIRQPGFNDLNTENAPACTGGPKVSVLMTCYMPDREEFLTAVNSILRQSWQNLELIIVDDASPIEFEPVLEEAENSDPRVRVIRQEENGGTYRARNTGITAATGAFITGQDSDDWSHPERLATQVEYLLASPSTPGVVVEAIRTDNALVRTFPGRIPHGPCEVSFMLRAELAREVGGYLEARKGADGEFRRRVEKYTGREVEILAKPLYIIRIGHDSLSRADFMPGWSHPVRRAFWNSTRHWHENTLPAQLRLTPKSAAPIPIPARFKVVPPRTAPEYDVVFVGDWRAYTGTQRAMIDEITALHRTGEKIGILHLESVMSPSKETSRLSSEVQAMINAGEVGLVIPDEDASTRVAILHDPTILHFTAHTSINLTAGTLIIMPDMPPPSKGAGDTIYLPEKCDQLASKIFDSRVIWTSSDPEVSRLLSSYEPDVLVDPHKCPVAFNPRHWSHVWRSLPHVPPIVGRHSANFEAMWPERFTTAAKIWPSDGSGEVRILGDARSYLRKYGKTKFPLDWVVFRDKEIRPEAFLRGLDFFVYFPDKSYPQGFSREAVEAAVCGAVVILPKSFEEAHGDMALYAEPEEIPSLIEYYSSDRSAFSKLVLKNRHLSYSFDNQLYTSHVRYLEELTNTAETRTPERHA